MKRTKIKQYKIVINKLKQIKIKQQIKTKLNHK